MRSILILFGFSFLFLSLVTGCEKSESGFKFPDETPDMVVTQFFDLLGTGGKLTSKEALQMVSSRYSSLNQNSFRKWTQDFSEDSKVKAIKTIMPESRNKNGDYVASVLLETTTPSMFDDSFTSTSRMNLILDEEANEWKIDFVAETINEEGFLKAPADANARNLPGGDNS